MTDAAAILQELRQRNFTVTVDGDELCIRFCRRPEDDFLRRVKDAKPAIVQLVRGYMACFHCNGSGRCGCSTCFVPQQLAGANFGRCRVCVAREVRTGPAASRAGGSASGSATSRQGRG
jgi:hypothetical protein